MLYDDILSIIIKYCDEYNNLRLTNKKVCKMINKNIVFQINDDNISYFIENNLTKNYRFSCWIYTIKELYCINHMFNLIYVKLKYPCNIEIQKEIKKLNNIIILKLDNLVPIEPNKNIKKLYLGDVDSINTIIIEKKQYTLFLPNMKKFIVTRLLFSNYCRSIDLSQCKNLTYAEFNFSGINKVIIPKSMKKYKKNNFLKIKTNYS